MLFLEHFGTTDTGKTRQNNEDSLLAGEGRDPTLLAVADGIGGFEAGEVASSIAIGVLKELDPETSFMEAIQEANRRILTAAREDARRAGMGTTVVALRFAGSREQPVAEVAHVGDSRAYLLRGGELRRLTEDHSLVAELVKSGDLTQDEAAEHPQKNLITRALGAEEEVEADVSTLEVEAGDRLILCSDGLSDMVPDEKIREILSGTRGSPERAARRLVSESLEAGGLDNVTVIVADVREEREENAAGRASDTTELGAAAETALRPADPDEQRRATLEAKRMRAERARRRKLRRKRIQRAFAALIRGVAALIVIAALLTPAYLWASSRYYLGFEGNRVVVHQGLPYTVGGVKLNKVFRRTGLTKSEIKGPYQSQIQEHRMYSKQEIRRILRDLRSS